MAKTVGVFAATYLYPSVSEGWRAIIAFAAKFSFIYTKRMAGLLEVALRKADLLLPVLS